MNIIEKPFGTTNDGVAVKLFALRNNKGAEVTITNYGGLVTTLQAPDRNGKLADVVLGYDNLADYIKASPYFGALVGRYGNRIANAKFTLGGKTYTLAANNGVNALHGGLKGFDKVVWEPRAYQGKNGPVLELNYLSKDGEEGYPGNLSVKAVYTWTDDNALQLEYTATTDMETVVNLTQHSYFNLECKGKILNHVAQINADKFTPVNETLIPTGEIAPVAGTPFDFRKPTVIGSRIDEDHPQLKLGKGYDHNFVFNKPAGELGLMGRVYEPTTGRVLEVLSTAPGMQFYTGNFLKGTLTGKGGWIYEFRNGFCMEPQHFPDSPNQPNFPSTVLKPGRAYHHTVIYRFSVQS